MFSLKKSTFYIFLFATSFFISFYGETESVHTLSIKTSNFLNSSYYIFYRDTIWDFNRVSLINRTFFYFQVKNDFEKEKYLYFTKENGILGKYKMLHLIKM